MSCTDQCQFSLVRVYLVWSSPDVCCTWDGSVWFSLGPSGVCCSNQFGSGVCCSNQFGSGLFILVHHVQIIIQVMSISAQFTSVQVRLELDCHVFGHWVSISADSSQVIWLWSIFPCLVFASTNLQLQQTIKIHGEPPQQTGSVINWKKKKLPMRCLAC